MRYIIYLCHHNKKDKYDCRNLTIQEKTDRLERRHL